MSAKKGILGLIFLAVLSTVWLIGNPPGRFGWSCFGYSTYGALPRPLSDFQVRADGATRKMTRTHELAFEQIQWLLDPKPEVLIIATGWDGAVTPDPKIREHKDCEVHLLKNRPAIDLFNRLKRSGKRVAIHYHSTC